MLFRSIARNLDISEVVNNNLRDDDSEAVIYGKGVGSGYGKMRFPFLLLLLP